MHHLMKRAMVLPIVLLLFPMASSLTAVAQDQIGWTATENAEWKHVDFSQTAIAPGSALDMSRFVEGPSGRDGRVIVGADGHFAFEKRPDKRIIFFGCSIAPHQILGSAYTTKEEIKRWAGMVRQQGYNLVRPHFLDHYLTGASITDLEFDPEALDRFDYLVACLKENGIYLYFDAMTSWRGYKAGPGWTPKARTEAFKTRIFYDESVREHWKTGVGKLLQHMNPYTKTRLVDDPEVAVVLFFNEQNMNFYAGINEAFTAPWRAWLKKKYGTNDAFRKAWVDERGKGLLKEGVTLENVPLFEVKNIWQTDARNRDVGLFIYDIHAELLDWYVKTIREIGYTGLITHDDWLYHLGIQALRNRVPVISMHNYHAHPSDFSQKGSKINQDSALASAGKLFCSMATTRYGGRPLMFTEYGEVFWNKYRYEEGLLMGGYAAFQDLDCLMPHASPVQDGIKSPIQPFSVAHDPVARASQVVAGYAYVRRDVTPSAHYVDIPLQKAYIFDAGQHAKTISADQSKLALLAGVGISYADEPAPKGLGARKPDLRMPVFGTSKALVHELFTEVLDDLSGEKPLGAAVDSLKKAGILAASNRTDPVKGVYESDSGQLLMDAPRHRLQVVTPRLEGVCVDLTATPGRVALKQLVIEGSSIPAAVTAIAVDDRPLAESRRILLVYATDALNSGMAFDSPKRETLVANGKQPVLMRTGQLKVSISGSNVAGMKGWALGLNGRRVEPVAATAEGKTLSVSIDTARLKAATPFFELAAE